MKHDTIRNINTKWKDWRLREGDETALPMVQALNTLDADIRRADYNKQLEWGAKNSNKVKEIIKAANMLSKIMKKLK
jgi:hypothetical protein|tara:strand:+ start:64 stop:294 length:231 start_codon:yes stop_codon:yes gene_type:complete